MRFLALCVLVLSLHAAELPFKAPPAYSCDIAFTDGAEKVTGRQVVGGVGKQRMEVSMDGQQAVMLLRHDLKKMWMLMPSEKMAMVMAYDPAQAKDPTQDPNAAWKKSGTETVNGVACDRYEWTSGEEKGTGWIDAKLGVIIRVKSGTGQGDFTNYQIGAQKAELFELPKDYQVMEGFGGMMPGGR